MAPLRKTFIDLTRNRMRWERMRQAETGWRPSGGKGRLAAVEEFGSNSGRLVLFAHVPMRLPRGAPLVVVLHGCTQTAASYDEGSGWSRLADERGFAVAFAQQRSENNGKSCFNWFDPNHTARGRGEAQSIAQMVEHMIGAHGLDRRRVYITGLSAGGAMTTVMLATYPELFAGGAVIAGLPFAAAHTVQQAFEGMFKGRSRPASEWGRLVREASSHRGPWPKVSVWHGTEDKTVKPVNADELVKQWTDVHGLRLSDGEHLDRGGIAIRRWRGPGGETLVEEILVKGMAHGTPVDGQLDGAGRPPPPFMLDVGISSTRRIAASWGLAKGPDVLDRIGTEEPGRERRSSFGQDTTPGNGARFGNGANRATGARPADHAGRAGDGDGARDGAGPAHQGKKSDGAPNVPPSMRVAEVIHEALRRAGLISR